MVLGDSAWRRAWHRAFCLIANLSVKCNKKASPDFESGWFVSLFSGLLRISIFILYIWLVSLMREIRRTFEYHGAGHKSIACYEAGLELTPENDERMHSVQSALRLELYICNTYNQHTYLFDCTIRLAVVRTVGSKILMLPLLWA